MKRKLIALLCVLALAVLCLASCGCKHTFSDEWYSDETHHWHPATCDHAETERGDFGPHVDEDDDGICDVCDTKAGHTHTYESAWQTDDFHHWKNPTCSHTAIEDNETYGLHVDEDLNGVCEVCEQHAHDVNGAGFCKFDFCGKKVREVDENNLESIINAVTLQAYLIKSGTVEYDFIGRSNTNASYEVTRKQNIVYEFGKDNFTYTKVTTNVNNGGVEGSDVYEGWHQLDGKDRVFGMVSENGGPLALDLPEVGRLNGYHIDLSDLAGDYGVESALFALYEAAISDTTDSLVVIPDSAENKVVFKYSYKTFILNTSNISYGDNAGETVYNLHYYVVEVEFRYDDDFALTSLDIKLDCYTSDPGTSDIDGFLYKDVDIIYDPDTDTVNFVEYVQENGEWVAYPTEKRTPDTYTVSVTQTVGDRTKSNDNPKSKFIPVDFDIFATKEYTYDSNGIEIDYELKDKITGNLFVGVGDIVNIYPGNYYPTGTSLHIVADYVSIKLYKDGAIVENFEDYMNTTAVAMFSGATEEDRTFFVVPKVDGAYKLEIYLMGDLVKTVNIIAGIVDEENIELKANEFAVKVTEAYEWANEYTFTATKTGTYYFNLPAGVGFIDADGWDAASATPETDDGPEPYFDYNSAKNPDGTYNAGSFSIKLEEGQSIRFYVNSIKKGTYVIKWAAV